jgi:predicted RNA-binding protein with RPS1 domain
MRDTTFAASLFAFGETRDAVINGIHDDGVFVELKQGSGLCHVRDYRNTASHASLHRGQRVTVEVLGIRDDGKLSLALLEVRAVNTAPDRMARRTRMATNAALSADAVQYASGIGKAFEAGCTAVNEVGRAFANNDARSRAGMVAEAVHVADFNVDARIKRSRLRAERVNSYGKASPDIRVRDGAGAVVQEISSKVCFDAKASADGQRPYGKQTHLVPRDQLQDVKKHASRKAASNRAKQSPQRVQVAMEHQQVADLATDHVEQGGVRSKARTRQESQKLGNKAKERTFSGADLGPGAGRAALDGAMAGAKGGAIIGGCIGAASGAVKLNRARGKDRGAAKKVASEVAVDVVAAATDGAVMGALCGGATAAAQVTAQRIASATAKRVLNGSAPAVLAITAFELAKHSVDLARGKSTADEFKAAAGQTVLNNSATFIGAEVGFVIGEPIGALVGGIAAPLLMAAGRSLFGRRLVEAELPTLLDTRAAFDAAFGYHLAQLTRRPSGTALGGPA